MNARFGDIGGIDDHHYLKLLFMIQYTVNCIVTVYLWGIASKYTIENMLMFWKQTEDVRPI